MLPELVAAVPHLTPAERRVAETVVAEPTLVAFGTVAEVAARSSASGPTVVRFATKLGFDGFVGLQQAVQASVAERLQRAADRIRLDAGDDPVTVARATAMANVAGAFGDLDRDDLAAPAGLLSDPSATVWILTSEAARPVGHTLSHGLAMLRPRVRSLGGSPVAVAREVLDAGDGDVAVVVDFPRYERWVLDAARSLGGAGVALVVLTDGPLSPLAEGATALLEVPVAPIGPFDSNVGAVALAEALVAEVASLRRDLATERLDRSEDAWSTLFRPPA